MRIFCLLLIFLGIIFLSQAFVLNKEMAALGCKAKYNVPAYDIENIKNRKLPESKEGKCMMACILKKLNVINQEGKFEVNTVKGWMADKYKDNKQKLTRAYAKADSCAEQLPSLSGDECEYAAKILECSKKKKKKM